jgi:hypothetical protein
MSYFAGVCYLWAAAGIGSRIAMAVMGPKWKSWEVESAYARERPLWVLGVGLFGLALITYTWYRVVFIPEPYGWIIAALISLTGIKAGMFLFKYDQFRSFVVKALSNRGRMAVINSFVLLFSAALVLMGALLYG